MNLSGFRPNQLFRISRMRLVYLNMVEANNRMSGLLYLVMQSDRYLEKCHVTINVTQLKISPFALLR